MEAIQKYPLPSNVKQLQRFLGMIQFYMLRGVAKGSKSLPWNEAVEKAFFRSKSLLADASLSVFATASSAMSIYADASDIAIAAVLQIKQLGVWCSVAFFSRRLDKTQQKYLPPPPLTVSCWQHVPPLNIFALFWNVGSLHCSPIANFWFVPL